MSETQSEKEKPVRSDELKPTPPGSAKGVHIVSGADTTPERQNVAMTFSTMQQTKSAEMFNAAVDRLKDGYVEEAILLLQEAEFFTPEDPTPLVAHAECYVYLCDLQSAIRYYRRALWVVQRRDQLNPTQKKPSTLVPTKNLSSAIPVNSNSISNSGIPNNNQFFGSGGAASAHSEFHSSGPFSPLPPLGLERAKTIQPDDASTIQDHFGEQLQTPVGNANVPLSHQHPLELEPDAIAENSQKMEGDTNAAGIITVVPPDTIGAIPHSPHYQSNRGEINLAPALFKETPEGTAVQNSGSLWQNSRTQRMHKTSSEIQLVDIQTRLAGLLDAMSLSLFGICDFAAALQCSEDSLALVDDPVVQLHRCVFLVSLHREEEAESLLETHLQKFKHCSVQTSAMLIQLYVNRQAFRPARMLLDNFTGTSRNEECITVARHIFNTKYERYRKKALEKKDVGTISKCIDVFPNDVELLFARGKIRIAEGDHKKSVKDLFRCVKETNGSHKEAIETMTSVLFTIGTSLDGEEGIQEAVIYYSESLKWRADNTLVLLARGDCYVKLEQYQEALADYRRMIQIDPDDATASKRIAFLHDLWGRKFYRQQKVKDAEIEFTNAIKQCDTEPLFYYHRALCRFYLNEPRYGLRDVLTCQQLNPTDPAIKSFIVRYLGTTDVPDTSKSFKQAEMNMLVREDHELGTKHLTNANAPPSSQLTAKVAKKYYGRPSARIKKVLLDAQSVSEATGRGCMPVEKVFASVHGATSHDHTGFVDFVVNNAPEGELTVVKGMKAGMTAREPPPRPKKVEQLRSTRLPSILKKSKRATSTAEPHSDSHSPSTSGKNSKGPSLRPTSSHVQFVSEVRTESAGSAVSERERSPIQPEETLPG